MSGGALEDRPRGRGSDRERRGATGGRDPEPRQRKHRRRLGHGQLLRHRQPERREDQPEHRRQGGGRVLRLVTQLHPAHEFHVHQEEGAAKIP